MKVDFEEVFRDRLDQVKKDLEAKLNKYEPKE